MIRPVLALARRHSHVNWALADQALVSGANFLTGILLARYLGLEEFGRFTLVWMVVVFATVLQSSAILAPMMSIGPKQAMKDVPGYYGACQVQQLAFAALCAGLVWTATEIAAGLAPEWRIADLGLPLAAAVFTTQLQEFVRRHFFARGMGNRAFLVDVIRYGGTIIVLLTMLDPAALSVRRVAWVMALCAAAAMPLAVIWMPSVQWNIAYSRSAAGRNWQFGRWLLISGPIQWISGHIFIVTAGTMIGPSAAGALKTAQNLVAVLHILFQGLENHVPVRAAVHLRSGGIKALDRYLARVLKYGGGITLLVTATVSIVPEFWLRTIYGAGFEASAQLLRLYSFLYLLLFVGLTLRVKLRTIERTRPIFLAYFYQLACGIVLAYPTVHYWGTTGAAIGMNLAVFAHVLIIYVYSSERGHGHRRIQFQRARGTG